MARVSDASQSFQLAECISVSHKNCCHGCQKVSLQNINGPVCFPRQVRGLGWMRIEGAPPCWGDKLLDCTTNTIIPIRTPIQIQNGCRSRVLLPAGETSLVELLQISWPQSWSRPILLYQHQYQYKTVTDGRSWSRPCWQGGRCDIEPPGFPHPFLRPPGIIVVILLSLPYTSFTNSFASSSTSLSLYLDKSKK